MNWKEFYLIAENSNSINFLFFKISRKKNHFVLIDGRTDENNLNVSKDNTTMRKQTIHGHKSDAKKQSTCFECNIQYSRQVFYYCKQNIQPVLTACATIPEYRATSEPFTNTKQGSSLRYFVTQTFG